MMEITMSQVQVQVRRDNNIVFLMIRDPQSGIVVNLPFTAEEAKKVGAQLSSNVAVASLIVPPSALRTNGA